MPKKGELARAKLAGFALAIFIAVILLAFTGRISLLGEELSVTEQCRASVIRNARYHIAGIDLGSEIDCPTRKIVLEKENDEEAKEKIANSMYTCWNQFGEGRLNLFSGEGVYCNVCYIIDVKTKEPITDFTDYLKTTPSPEENIYYYDYLSGFKTSDSKESGVLHKAQRLLNSDLRKAEGLELQQLNLKGDVINTDSKYATIFVYAKGTENIEKLVRQIGLQSAAGKVITPIAIGSATAAGISTGIAVAYAGSSIVAVVGVISGIPVIMVAVVGAPVIVVAGAAVGAGVLVFAATELVGSLFNPDSPPEWSAFTVLRPWNPAQATETLWDELGCTEFVETQTS